ncbi:hypothetical protein PSHT_15611 [Puccinia striiformis]|uniref:Uncharacterized protein n=1 Tax=Puccinia striiformis TaxID=27350 RepID=A0A2S4UE86_9BASI|nr:hypothetical protein PSHT_15611 [Puccinia striiformis]
MGAHLRNGRNISAEQRQELDFQSKYPISPAAAERLRRIRAQPASSTRPREDPHPAGSHRPEHGSIPQGSESVGDIPSSSVECFDSGAGVHRQTRVESSTIHSSTLNPSSNRAEPANYPSHELSPSRNPYREQTRGDSGDTLRPSVGTRQSDARQSVVPVRESQRVSEHTSDEDRSRTSNLHPRFVDESHRQGTNAPSQRRMVGQSGDGLPRDFTSKQYQSSRSDLGTDTSRAYGLVDPSPTHGESTIPQAYPSFKQPSADLQNPSSDPRHHVPGSYSLCDLRAVTSTPSAANSTAYYTPGAPESTRRVETHYAPANIHQPSTSTPLRPAAVPPPAPPSLRSSSPTQWWGQRTRLETCRPDSDHGQDGSIFRKGGESTGTNEQTPWSRQGRKKPPLSTISESESTPISSPLENHNNPSLHSSSDPSSREQFLNNLHSQFVPDTTL